MSKCQWLGGVGAIALLSFGILLFSTDSQVFNFIYRSQLVLSPNSTSFPMWRDIPALTANIYLFNVTNPDQVTNEGAVPIVSEVGPFVFMESHHKTKLVWNPNNTITYQQIRNWKHVAELTNGSLSDKITIVNPIAASIADLLRVSVPKSLHLLVDLFLRAEKEKIFVTHTANEIIFKGFDDPILKAMNDAKFIIKNYIPDGAFMDKFAFFYARNGSDWMDGVFNMYTGADDTSKMGKVHSWNYSTQNFFPGTCGKVKGGAGEFFPPGLNKTYIEMYSNDLCRTLRFDFNETSSPRGIPTYEYTAGRNMFGNGSVNPDNKCFNPTTVSLPSGVFNTSICRFGAPVFVSQPHFYLADPYYSSLVHGMRPDHEKHTTSLKIEPLSGVPVEVMAKFQLNILIDKVPDVVLFKHLPRSFVPVMWVENAAGVPDNMVFQMKLFAMLKDILQGVGWGMFGLGVGIMLILTVKFISRRKPEEDGGPLLPEGLAEESDSENVFHE